MTLETFLRKLRKTPRTWRVERNGKLRNRAGRCPIEAVYGIADWMDAPEEIDPISSRVIQTADQTVRDDDYDPRLRARLLRACGVTERA